MSLPASTSSTLRPGSRWAAFGLGLALLALALMLGLWRTRPPAPLGLAAPDSEFSAGRARLVLEEFLGDEQPHPVGGTGHAAAQQRLLGQLQALGYMPQVQQTRYCGEQAEAMLICAPVQNIYVQLDGQRAGPALLLVTHYDSAAAGPGASDDGTGVAILLEIARIFRQAEPLANPVVFLFTDGEELGLQGARAFMEQPPVGPIGAVINLEARGTSGLSLMFETSPNNAWLIKAYANSVRQPASSSLFYEIYRLMPNDTDLTVFKDAGLPGMNFAFVDGKQHYHTPLDNLANLDMGTFQHHGESVLAVARTLAAADLSGPHPAENRVYMDISGLSVLGWPQGWTLPLALLPLALLGGLAYWLSRSDQGLTLQALLWGLLAALMAVILPVLLGLALVWLAGIVTTGAQFGYAYPLPLRLALWAGALFCLALSGRLLARRAGFWGLGLGSWLLVGLLGLILAIALPGASILLIVPALAAALLLGGTAFSPLGRSAPGRWLAFGLAAALAALFWLPLSLLFEATGGFLLGPAITLLLGLSFAPLLPLLDLELPAQAPGWRRWLERNLLPAGAALGMLAALVAALLVPPFSAGSPQPLNFLRYQDAGSDQAYYIVRPQMGDIPTELTQALDLQQQSVYTWYEALRPVAVAARLPLPAPELVVVSDEVVNGERSLTLRLQAPESISELIVMLPLKQLSALTVQGKPLTLDHSLSYENYNLDCYGGCDGLELQLRLADAQPLKVVLLAYTYGLPPEDAPLLKLRPAAATPSNFGDMILISVKVEF